MNSRRGDTHTRGMRRAWWILGGSIALATLLHTASLARAVPLHGPLAAASSTHQSMLRYPAGIALDAQGQVYITDSIDDRLQKLSPQGRVIATWGHKGSGPGQFDGVSGVAVDAQGNIFVADTRNHRVQKLSPQGRSVARWSRSRSRLLFEPGGVSLDGRGKLYVADGENAWIEVLSSSGTTLARLGSFENPSTGQFAGPSAVAVDTHGYVYVADYTWITKLSAGGKPVATWGKYGHDRNRFQLPSGVAVDRIGDIYVSDALANRIDKLSPDGKLLHRWGTMGHRPGQLDGPTGVALDARGNVYVSDFGNHRVEKFSSDGRLLAAWQ